MILRFHLQIFLKLIVPGASDVALNAGTVNTHLTILLNLLLLYHNYYQSDQC